jgi:hypothetical protein
MWLNKVTLDIIGLAGNSCSLSSLFAHSESHVGFNYAFDSLHSPTEEKKTNDIYWAIRSSASHALSPGPLFFIQLLFPMLRHIVNISLYQMEGKLTELSTFLQPTRGSRLRNRDFKEIQRTGSQLIRDRKSAIRSECDVNGSSAVGRQHVGGHDLLSLLIKANIAADMPESMRMSDTEILAREHIVPFT